jgi:hypothetical protein
MSWLTELIDQHKEFESPITFVYWAALTSISAVVKDQIWFDKYLYKLYPNIYVMFHADSGVKKSPPINMAAKLVKMVNNTHMIQGRSSIQGILKDMGTSETRPGGVIVDKSNVFICSAEMSSSLVEDKAALDILTDLFDRQNRIGEWRSLLKMESFELKNPTVTMLTATNEAHSDEFFTGKDIHGGYIGRTFIIHEHKSKIINSLMFPPEKLPNLDESAKYLKELSKLKGPFEMDTEVRQYFDQWYRDFRIGIENSEDRTGTLNRFDDSVLKVAMLISLAEQPCLKITKSAIESAIVSCEKLVGNVRKTTLTKGRGQRTNEMAILIKELVDRDGHMISRQQLNRKYWMNATAVEWDEIVYSLEAQGALKVEVHGNMPVYVMSESEVEKWSHYFKGKR